MDYTVDGRVFRAAINSENGEVGSETRFYYHQSGKDIRADYSGGQIERGQLLGVMEADGRLRFAYHHLNVTGELMSGQCISTPGWTDGGKLYFDENWQWLSGDCSCGTSRIIEV